MHTLGIAEDGVGVAMDENNADLVTDEMEAAVEDAREKIASGETEVHDYSEDESCPAINF